MGGLQLVPQTVVWLEPEELQPEQLAGIVFVEVCAALLLSTLIAGLALLTTALVLPLLA